MTSTAQPLRRASSHPVDRARDQLARLDRLIDVQLAQLAHTDRDNPRWARLRNAIRSEDRLTAARAVVANDSAAIRRIAGCAFRWLRRTEPVLALVGSPLNAEDDNVTLFRGIRACADEQRDALQTLGDDLATLPSAQIWRIASLDARGGLGVLNEVWRQDGLGPQEPWDSHIRAMLDDADAWCALQGGQHRAMAGLVRLAEAALLAPHFDPTIEVDALFGRYVGAPQLHTIADLRPDHVLAFDALFARRGHAAAPALRLAIKTLAEPEFEPARQFFDRRIAAARSMGVLCRVVLSTRSGSAWVSHR